MCDLPRPFILVLDDYHALQNREIDALLAELLRSGPASMHLVIASREDPLLPLAGLRGGGQMEELRGGNLRFTREEITAYLRQLDPGTASEELVAQMEEQTEGWVTSLYLATLPLRNPDFAPAFPVDAMAGNRHVTAYLARAGPAPDARAPPGFPVEDVDPRPALRGAVRGRSRRQRRRARLPGHAGNAGADEPVHHGSGRTGPVVPLPQPVSGLPAATPGEAPQRGGGRRPPSPRQRLVRGPGPGRGSPAPRPGGGRRRARRRPGGGPGTPPVEPRDVAHAAGMDGHAAGGGGGAGGRPCSWRGAGCWASVSSGPPCRRCWSRPKRCSARRAGPGRGGVPLRAEIDMLSGRLPGHAGPVPGGPAPAAAGFGIFACRICVCARERQEVAGHGAAQHGPGGRGASLAGPGPGSRQATGPISPTSCNCTRANRGSSCIPAIWRGWPRPPATWPAWPGRTARGSTRAGRTTSSATPTTSRTIWRPRPATIRASWSWATGQTPPRTTAACWAWPWPGRARGGPKRPTAASRRRCSWPPTCSCPRRRPTRSRCNCAWPCCAARSGRACLLPA